MSEGLGICCIIGATGLALIGLNCFDKADSLRRVTRIKQLQDLKPLVENPSSKSPLMVAIDGKVGSNEPPFMCQGLQFVVLKEETEELIWQQITKVTKVVKKKDAEEFTKEVTKEVTKQTTYWRQITESIWTVHKEVPWYLDDGTSRVYVGGAAHASDWESSVVRGGNYKSWSLTTKGKGDTEFVKTTRPILSIGTSLTVTGEAVKDAKGTIQIRQPENGPFYVTRRGFDKMISIVDSDARCCTYFSVVMALCGILMIVCDPELNEDVIMCHPCWKTLRHIGIMKTVIQTVLKSKSVKGS